MSSVSKTPYNRVFRCFLVVLCIVVIALLGDVTAHMCQAGESAPNIALITAADLQKDLSAWVILDARPVSQWQAGHIPGAFSFSWKQYTRTDEKKIPYRILPPEKMAAVLGGMGIDENTKVAVYGDADTSWGGEGWACWALCRLGHKGPIRLLDGGIQAWKQLRYPVETGQNKSASKTVLYRFHLRSSIMITADAIQQNHSDFQLVDTRSFPEWIMGRIPGAVRIKWTDFYTGAQHRPLPPERLRALLIKNGIDPEKPVVYYCTGGIRSGYAWLVHQLSGLPAALNFEGGMAEWEKSNHS